MPGLSLNDIVNVSVNITPNQIAVRNFGAMLAIGPTDVIPVSQRIRQYTTLTGVQGDFGTTTPEYLAATAFFSQSPQPSILYIGRWAQTATAGRLTGGYINPTNQAATLTALQAIATPQLTINIGGTAVTTGTMNFASSVTYAQVASVIQAALISGGATGATVTWDSNNNQFNIRGGTTGTAATIAYPTTNAHDISPTLMLTAAAGATLSQGVAAETPLAAVAALIAISNDWYGAAFAPTNYTDLAQADYLSIAATVEAASPPRIFGYNSQDGGVLSGSSTTDTPYLLNQSAYKRTCTQYSSTSLYAIFSLFGRAFSVNFTGNNTTITLNGKIEPGVLPETLTETQNSALKTKCANVFVNYSGAAAYIQYGTMANGFYFDEVQGCDWLANDIQTRLLNTIVNAQTKIPQTDPGITILKNSAEAGCVDAVFNGLVAPGVWNGPPIGTIVTGQVLPAGYYVYAPPIASQSTSARQSRVAPTLQVCVCLAGAVHSANVLLNVQR